MKNILLTGMPGTGKSTLLEEVISMTDKKKGFIAKEVRIDGERKGFEIVTSYGERKMLSSVDFISEYKVSKYGVDVEGFEDLLGKFFSLDDEVLYIDEIGRMELFSDKFKMLVRKYLDSDNIFIGTITMNYSDEFIESVKTRQDVRIFEVNEENRHRIYEEVIGILHNNGKNL